MNIEYKLERHPIEVLTITVKGMKSIDLLSCIMADGSHCHEPDIVDAGFDSFLDDLDEFLKNYRE